MSPACIEVSGIEPLQESHMVEALSLWVDGGGLWVPGLLRSLFQ